MTVTAIVGDDHCELVPDRLPLISQRLTRTNFLSSLAFYPHTITPFLVLHTNVSVLHARRHAICPMSIHIAPFGPCRLPFSDAFFFLSPFLSPHLSKSSSSLPSQSITFISTSHEQNVASKAILHFLRNQARNTRNATQASSAWIIYVSIPPPVVFISHKQKKGYRVCG